ncbi:hypothetical protein MIR68_000432 [Amoeboaphelidium protococcarum]|nr:hypothetical protein MIR68_000432 [Amoeboaphelidium protococcarum]
MEIAQYQSNIVKVNTKYACEYFNAVNDLVTLYDTKLSQIQIESKQQVDHTAEAVNRIIEHEKSYVHDLTRLKTMLIQPMKALNYNLESLLPLNSNNNTNLKSDRSQAANLDVTSIFNGLESFLEIHLGLQSQLSQSFPTTVTESLEQADRLIGCYLRVAPMFKEYSLFAYQQVIFIHRLDGISPAVLSHVDSYISHLSHGNIQSLSQLASFPLQYIELISNLFTDLSVTASVIEQSSHLRSLVAILSNVLISIQKSQSQARSQMQVLDLSQRLVYQSPSKSVSFLISPTRHLILHECVWLNNMSIFSQVSMYVFNDLLLITTKTAGKQLVLQQFALSLVELIDLLVLSEDDANKMRLCKFIALQQDLDDVPLQGQLQDLIFAIKCNGTDLIFACCSQAQKSRLMFKLAGAIEECQIAQKCILDRQLYGMKAIKWEQEMKIVRSEIQSLKTIQREQSLHRAASTSSRGSSMVFASSSHEDLNCDIAYMTFSTDKIRVHSLNGGGIQINTSTSKSKSNSDYHSMDRRESIN